MKAIRLAPLPTYRISPLQLFGFILSNFIGLGILLLGIQLYQDLGQIFKDEDGIMNKDYLIITKRVSSINTIGNTLGLKGDKNFSADEIDEIKDQPWAKNVGAFNVAQYSVIGSVSQGFGEQGMSTLLFFESVPDEYLDITPSSWSFNPDKPNIPIIIPKDYLTLYNFGLAETQGLPQLSESIIGHIPINFQLIGDNGSVLYLQGNIVGFSQRINTIIVPDTFMKWSNSQLTTPSVQPPSRLIIEVSQPGDVAIEKFFKERSYEVAGDKGQSNKMAYFFSLAVTIVLSIGALITLLAFFILLLSVHLLLVKNQDRIKTLFLIGYTPLEVAHSYYRLVLGANIVAWKLALGLLLMARALYAPMLESLSTLAFPWRSISFSLLLIVLLSGIHLISIQKKLKSFCSR